MKNFRAGPSSTRLRGNRLFSWLQIAALMAALGALLLVGSGATTFGHVDGSGSTESTCPICHVAHLPVLLAPALAVQGAGFVVARIVLRTKLDVPSALPSVTPPSRAPPAC